jgi:hypothetical protein
MDNGITAILLNWKRPNNLRKHILPELTRCPAIKEIIISHGRRDTQFNWKTSTPIQVRHRDDSSLNQIFGLSLRFLVARQAKYSNILLVDDDVIPHPVMIINMFNRYQQNYPCIIGKYGRCLDSRLRYSTDPLPPNITQAPIILTSLMMFPKNLANLFFQESPKILRWVKNNSMPFWNGEDIFLSLLALIKFRKWGLVVNPDSYFPAKRIPTPDDHKIAISKQPGHAQYRTALIKKCQTLFGVTNNQLTHYNQR